MNTARNLLAIATADVLTGMSLSVFPVVDQVHIGNFCSDTLPPPGLLSMYATYLCYQEITHADYTMVSPTSLAKPGEALDALLSA